MSIPPETSFQEILCLFIYFFFSFQFLTLLRNNVRNSEKVLCFDLLLTYAFIIGPLCAKRKKHLSCVENLANNVTNF